MKVAILSRPGDCFPNIISLGLADMLKELRIEHKIFYNAVPFLMRVLPFNKKPKRWSNSFHFRLYNKIKYYQKDSKLLKELNEYDIMVLSECLPNALWKNYLAIEEFKKKTKKKVGSYTDGSIHIAPIHKRMLLGDEDFEDSRFDFNLFITDTIELKQKATDPRQRTIGLNLQYTGLAPAKKSEFIAVVDFAQKGYESYRNQQLKVLDELNIKTIILEGRHKIEEIRKIYQKSAIFFMAFPETFGLPIAECLACGSYIFTPNSGWPMSWRLNKHPLPWGTGILPDCFKVYNDEENLKQQLLLLRDQYNSETTPLEVFNTFIQNYPSFYFGDIEALKEMLEEFSAL